MENFKEFYELSNGTKIPKLGFGTYNSKGGDNLQMVKTAIEAGYRYFDTASLYGTEPDLGQAIEESGYAREDFQIASKAWWNEMGYKEVKEAFERSLKRLRTDYLDFYLIHRPKQNEKAQNWRELQWETWKAMEELVEEGRVKAIGLSNFLPHHLDNILEKAKIPPVVDQLELHPGYSQEAAVTYCREKNVQVQAWSPLGRGRIMENGFLIELSEKYKKSISQICLRFLLQKGIMPIVKSSSMERMKENMDVFSFEMEKADVQMLSCMPQNLWLGEHPDFAIPKKECKLF